MENFLQAFSAVASVFAFASFLAVVNERLVELLVRPITKAAGLSSDYLAYAAMATGAGISAAFGIDLFGPIAASLGIAMTVPWAGYALSAVLVGGGSNLLADVWPQRAVAD